jgi:mycothiol S-conjugate amidase
MTKTALSRIRSAIGGASIIRHSSAPFDERWLSRPDEDEKFTSSISLVGFEDVRREALLAHATQVDPTSKFWFGLPPEVSRTIYPFDDYVLARSLVDSELPETDLFAGVAATVHQ